MSNKTKFTEISGALYRITLIPESLDSFTHEVVIDKKDSGKWVDVDKNEIKEIWSDLQDQDII